MIASTHRLPPEFLDYYRVTGINESMKTSQSNRLKVSVSFNKHFRNVFNCKHVGCFFGEYQKLLSALSAILKRENSVFIRKQAFRNRPNETFECMGSKKLRAVLWCPAKYVSINPPGFISNSAARVKNLVMILGNFCASVFIHLDTTSINTHSNMTCQSKRVKDGQKEREREGKREREIEGARD